MQVKIKEGYNFQNEAQKRLVNESRAEGAFIAIAVIFSILLLKVLLGL